MALRQVGMICPPPLWIASVCSTTSHTCTDRRNAQEARDLCGWHLCATLYHTPAQTDKVLRKQETTVNSICVQDYITHLHGQRKCSGNKRGAQGTSWNEWVYMLGTKIGAALGQRLDLDLKVPHIQAYPHHCLGRICRKVHYKRGCFVMCH